MKKTKPTKKELCILFYDLEDKLRYRDSFDGFIDDLQIRISALNDERRYDLFVIKGLPLSTIKKVQAVGAALKKINQSDVSDLWSPTGDATSSELHSQLLHDCASKLKRDGFWQVEGSGEEIKHLRRCLKAVDEETSDQLWLALPNQSPKKLHQQLIKDCQEWDCRKDTEEDVRIALTDVAVGIAIDVAQEHLAIKICGGGNARFVNFATAMAGLVFNLKLGLDNEYSESTVRTWVKRYLRENYTKSTPLR